MHLHVLRRIDSHLIALHSHHGDGDLRPNDSPIFLVRISTLSPKKAADNPGGRLSYTRQAANGKDNKDNKDNKDKKVR
jgi:hypothetical protein